MLEGGCECGEVRYRLTSEPMTVNCCHCLDCQTITGSAFALNAMIETDRIQVTAGEPKGFDLHREGSGKTTSWRCPTCLTLLWADHPELGGAFRFIRVGTLDEAAAIVPDAHYFVIRKHPWVSIPAGVPTYDRLPGPGEGGWGPEAQARFKAALAR
jgi:hypothetical protein